MDSLIVNYKSKSVIIHNKRSRSREYYLFSFKVSLLHFEKDTCAIFPLLYFD